MCKYCKEDLICEGYEFFNVEGGLKKHIKIKGEKYVLLLEMLEGGNLAAEVFSVENGPIYTKKVKIKYCPWCGRKL